MSNFKDFDAKALFILPFDHRGSFMREMFNVLGKPDAEETQRISHFKRVIFEGFKLAVISGKIPRSAAGILADEQFSADILQEAAAEGFITAVCAEKSGQAEFDLEFGSDFAAHVQKFNPTFVKVLVRYNPDGDADLNERQAQKLQTLSAWCREQGFGLILEPLVVATSKQLELAGGDQTFYDLEMRPQLMELMMEELQGAGVEPDIWKIEGLEDARHYEALTAQAAAAPHSGKIIVLGRHATDEQVENWLRAGAQVSGVIGFAVGRTIFWEPLQKLKRSEIKPSKAAELIAQKFLHFYTVFQAGRSNLK